MSKTRDELLEIQPEPRQKRGLAYETRDALSYCGRHADTGLRLAFDELMLIWGANTLMSPDASFLGQTFGAGLLGLGAAGMIKNVRFTYKHAQWHNAEDAKPKQEPRERDDDSYWNQILRDASRNNPYGLRRR